MKNLKNNMIILLFLASTIVLTIFWRTYENKSRHLLGLSTFKSDQLNHLKKNSLLKWKIDYTEIENSLIKKNLALKLDTIKNTDISIVFYYNKFGCGSCVEKILTLFEAEQNSGRVNNFIVACKIENNRKLQAIEKQTSIKHLNYQNNLLDNLDGGNSILIFIKGTNIIDIISVDPNFTDLPMSLVRELNKLKTY